MLFYTCSTKVLYLLLFGSKWICLLYILRAPFCCSPPHLHCELKGTVLSIQKDEPGFSFVKWVGTKILGNAITEYCCYETAALFKEMSASDSVNSDYTFMHMYTLFSIYYTTLFYALPCAQPSLSAKTTPCLHRILWKPIWPEIPGSARIDSPSFFRKLTVEGCKALISYSQKETFFFKELATAQSKPQVGKGATNLLTENLIASLRVKSESKVFWQSRSTVFTKGSTAVIETWTQPQSCPERDGCREDMSWSA